MSAEQLLELGVHTVILGHSERRHIYGETNELINSKVLFALKNGMDVDLCVGETLDERESGNLEKVLGDQINIGLKGVSKEQMKHITIAYEPVWAIGTGKTATPEDADAAHGRPVFYAAVVARSYGFLRDQSKVMVDGWTYSPDFLRNGDKVLLVDDIFDTGKTVNALATIIMERGIPRQDLKIAVYDYKVAQYKKQEALPIQPDYYCRRHIINSPDEDRWIHYNCHGWKNR